MQTTGSWRCLLINSKMFWQFTTWSCLPYQEGRKGSRKKMKSRRDDSICRNLLNPECLTTIFPWVWRRGIIILVYNNAGVIFYSFFTHSMAASQMCLGSDDIHINIWWLGMVIVSTWSLKRLEEASKSSTIPSSYTWEKRSKEVKEGTWRPTRTMSYDAFEDQDYENQRIKWKLCH